MAKAKKVVYYTDKCKDDFAGTHINAKKIDGSYKYIHENLCWRACSHFLYRCIVFPLVRFYERVILGMRFVGLRNVRKLDTPVFLYGNHTGFYDAFTPNVISLPRRKNMIVTSADAVSIRGLSGVVKMLGALPVPSTYRGAVKFKEAIAHYSQSCDITIYPEAHIWPYYVGVREFDDSSFSYPVSLSRPAVAFFTAYSEPRGFTSLWRKASITVYVSEPFYPDPTLSPREARRKLRDQVFAFMKDCSERYSTYEVVEYRCREADVQAEEEGKNRKSEEKINNL